MALKFLLSFVVGFLWAVFMFSAEEHKSIKKNEEPSFSWAYKYIYKPIGTVSFHAAWACLIWWIWS